MNRTFKAFYLCIVFILFGLGALIIAQLVIEDEIQLQQGVRELHKYKCPDCNGVAANLDILLIHNCISTTTGKRELPEPNKGE